MIVFADSSALVKLYADEPDHEIIRKQGNLVVSALASVEVPTAIWRKHRMGELNPADAAILVAAFEADYHGSAAPALFRRGGRDHNRARRRRFAGRGARPARLRRGQAR